MTGRWAIHRAGHADSAVWAVLRHALWPDESVDRHPGEIDELLQREDWVAFIASEAGGVPVGFAEASVRCDYVNGTDSSPVAFLEGWYVAEPWRGRGIGAALVDAVAAWAREQGLAELASDTWLHNIAGQRAHLGCGFEETERVVYYRRRL